MLVTEAADTPFSVISPQRRLPSGQALYKLFSRAPLGAELHRLFSNATKVMSALMKTAGPVAASRCASSRWHGLHNCLSYGVKCKSRTRMQVAERDWYAYPKFAPPEDFAPFQLAKGIYYNNALENAASAMEMSAIAAKNSALLVRQHLASAWGAQDQVQQPSEATARA